MLGGKVLDHFRSLLALSAQNQYVRPVISGLVLPQHLLCHRLEYFFVAGCVGLGVEMYFYITGLSVEACRRGLDYIAVVFCIVYPAEKVENGVVEAHDYACAAPVGVFFGTVAAHYTLGGEVVGLYLASEQFAVGVAEAVD